MKRLACLLRFVVSSLLVILAVATPLWAAPTKPAAPAPIIPVPPEFVLDKQMEGEDVFWIYRPTFSPDQKLLAAFMHTTRTIRLWDTATGKVVKEISDDVHKMDALDGIEFTRDGKQLILLRNDKPMKWLDYNAAKITRELELNADPKKILDYAFNADQSRLALGTYTGIKYWDVTGGKQLAEYVKGKPVCAVDMIEYTTDTKPATRVRLLAWARALMPPEQKWTSVAGLVNLDSGATTPLLEDVPADKKIDDHMTFFRVRFDWGARYLLVGCYVIPPAVKAAVFLVNTANGKYIANTDLGQMTIDYDPRYLGKPFYGFLIATADMRDQSLTRSATQFLVAGRTELKILDTVDEKVLPTQSISVAPGSHWAAVCLKKSQSDTSKLYLYKLVPKKNPTP